MRKLIRQANFGLTEIENEEIWRCTTCGRCQEVCPREVKQIQDMVAVRRMATGYGVFPEHIKPVRAVTAGLGAEGNPFGEPRANRADWSKGLNVKTYEEGMEALYFPGCYLCYDPRLKKVAVATAKVLNAAGVDYGILGEEENCCGESIRKTGNEEMFKELAKANIKSWIDHGVKKIVVSSPHCYHTFKNEYPEFNVNFEILHISEFIGQLIKEGRLQINQEYAKKIIYHDPCYLGRHNHIYEEPREVLKSIPGAELVEFDENRVNSMCCGMGGGRIWVDTLMADRFVNLRLEQAVASGAQELVTTCPYCVTNFEDARVNLNFDNAIEIKDLVEVLAEVI